MQKRALVFSGQGSYRKGMCLNLINTRRMFVLWDELQDCMVQNYGISLQTVIQEDPTKLWMYKDALDVAHVLRRSCKTVQNVTESTPKSHLVENSNGVLSLSYITQPCVLAAQLLLLEKLQETLRVDLSAYAMIAGHSLGELTALCALGVFRATTALNLVFRRGLLMEMAVAHHRRSHHLMYACSPLHARLHDDPETADDLFFLLVELVSTALSTTTSFVEVVNFNMPQQQYVVAGDVVALAVLGKCLDPQFRANCLHPTTLDGIVRDALRSARLDLNDGIHYNPHHEKPSVDFATSARKKYGSRSTFRRFLEGPDDGHTPPPEKLTTLTLEDEGRSGLKRKSWFVPLRVEIPFHSSILRQCSDRFFDIAREALPEEQELRKILSVSPSETDSKRPLWVTNLTGRIFNPFDETFREETRDALRSLNIGEIRHKGRYTSNLLSDAFEEGANTNSVVTMCAAILASQISHPVMWIDSMEEMILHEDCRVIDEISPVRCMVDMFKRTNFKDKMGNSIEIKSTSYNMNTIFE
ncbi:unnamed protein product [Phytomonas sp. Hart1]|nr:unnamed protein product [Phytomonas sp. Hart1]|eukprot:CCW69514.1 unnamed protein product [Phytomonas sp. isolate Hart1]